jgi:ferrous iron transport protein B
MKSKKIALVGNPNTGKTTIFNRLTGLNQHVGNFPGVTVDKKTGVLKVDADEFEIVDLPGTYSLYPHSADERVVYDVVSDSSHLDYPNAIAVVVDASNLERNLLLFTQIYDLNIPTILIVNMSDLAHRKGIHLNLNEIQKRFPGIKLCETNGRIGSGISNLKKIIKEDFSEVEIFNPVIKNYRLASLEDKEQQKNELNERFGFIKEFVKKITNVDVKKRQGTSLLDRVTIHPIWGYLIFFLIMMSVFQLIFNIASLPMDLIDGAFVDLANWTAEKFPAGIFTDLLTGGIIPGLGGVLVFLPQILLLFLCLGILEETGYLSRAVFIMDRLMRPFGLSGKSVVPLISSAACAIPGVMATRTIPNAKERLISILVAPLMSCSARIPVFTLLIALVIPNKLLFGFINIQGLTLFALYFLGIISALIIAIILKKFIKTDEKSYLLMEIPDFKPPRWPNIFISLYEKGKVFIIEAGKIILIISILLWALATYGPSNRIKQAVERLKQQEQQSSLDYESKLATIKLENSYIGILGKTIEPVIKPLGFDWKIGISLITSFAAREVFVGSMSTIYSVHQTDDNKGLISTMRREKNPDGSPVYSIASGLSLMVFYVYAMQCMATLAIVKRETKSWKWPIFQLVYMGILAYLSSLFVFQILS